MKPHLSRTSSVLDISFDMVKIDGENLRVSIDRFTTFAFSNQRYLALFESIRCFPGNFMVPRYFLKRLFRSKNGMFLSEIMISMQNTIGNCSFSLNDLALFGTPFSSLPQ